MPFSIQSSTLIAGVIFGSIGFAAAVYGKKQRNLKVLATGIGLMIYPYFVDGALKNWMVGIILCVLAQQLW